LKPTTGRAVFIRLILLIVVSLFGIPARLRGQTTGFTYQGRLSDNGAPANGIYDLRFTIYDSDNGGAAVTSSITNRALDVSNGLFIVTLDFGAGIFDGSARWLDIGARTNGALDFTALNPRQMLTPTPTAIFATTAATALTISGTIPNESLSGAYGGAVTFNNSANSFSGNGAGLVNVAGTLPAQIVPGSMVQAQPNISYVLTNSQPVTVTLPAAPNLGDVVRVAGVGSCGWTLAQNSGQSVLGYNLVNPLTPWSFVAGPAVGQGQAIASSADGTHLIAGYAGFLEISSDSGATWSAPPNQPTGTGFQFALSTDGHHEAAAALGRYIYVSSDFGTNWIAETNSAVTSYDGIAMSADGSRLVAIASGGGIHASANFGTNWTLTSAPTNAWVGVASSADGSRLVAAAYLGGIYYSTNFGANWHLSAAPASNYWVALTSSADGTRVVAVETSSNAWFSTDAGQHWQSSPITSASFSAVACSADGLRVAASASGLIQFSTDGGLNWLPSHAPALSWRGVAASGNGNFFVNGSFSGVYAFRTSTATGTNGYLGGEPYSAIQVEYVGNGRFLPVSHEGTLLTH
jgi:hypothetical protein